MPPEFETSIAGVRATVPGADDAALQVATAFALIAARCDPAPALDADDEAEAIAASVLDKATAPPWIHVVRLGEAALHVELRDDRTNAEMASMIITLGEGAPTHMYDRAGHCVAISAQKDLMDTYQGAPESAPLPPLPAHTEVHAHTDDFVLLPKPSLSPTSSPTTLPTTTTTAGAPEPPPPVPAGTSKHRRKSLSPQKHRGRTPSISAAPVLAAAPVESLATATRLYPPPGAVRTEKSAAHGADSPASGSGSGSGSPSARSRTTSVVSTSRLTQVLSRDLDGSTSKRASGIFKRLFG